MNLPENPDGSNNMCPTNFDLYGEGVSVTIKDILMQEVDPTLLAEIVNQSIKKELLEGFKLLKAHLEKAMNNDITLTEYLSGNENMQDIYHEFCIILDNGKRPGLDSISSVKICLRILIQKIEEMPDNPVMLKREAA